MTDEKDYVPVLFAHSVYEAEFYQTLLEDHDINVYLGEEEEVDLEGEFHGDGIPVMVPREQLDEAALVIEQRRELDDEFAYVSEDFDENEDDYGDLSPDLGDDNSSDDEEESF